VALGNAITTAAGNNAFLIELLGDPPTKAGVALPDIKTLLFSNSGGAAAEDRDVVPALLARVLASRNGDSKDRDGLMCGCGG